MALSGTGWELCPPLLRTSRRRSRYHFSAACISFEMRLSFANWPLPPSFRSGVIGHRLGAMPALVAHFEAQIQVPLLGGLHIVRNALVIRQLAFAALIDRKSTRLNSSH